MNLDISKYTARTEGELVARNENIKDYTIRKDFVNKKRPLSKDMRAISHIQGPDGCGKNRAQALSETDKRRGVIWPSLHPFVH